MKKCLLLALPVIAALLPSAGHAAEPTARDLTDSEKAAIAGGVQFLVRTPDAAIRWLPIYLSGQNPQETAYCGIVNNVYLFEVDVTVRDGSVADIGQIRLALQNDEARRREVEGLCSAAGYGAQLGATFLDQPAN